MRKLFSALCVASLSSCAAMPAMAQELPPNCHEFSAAREEAAGYGEQPFIAGASDSGNVFEVWLNQEGGTWVVFHTRPDMVTCVVDFGDMFIAAPQQPDV